jgi:hypothetical protein
MVDRNLPANADQEPPIAAHEAFMAALKHQDAAALATHARRRGGNDH